MWQAFLTLLEESARIFIQHFGQNRDHKGIILYELHLC